MQQDYIPGQRWISEAEPDLGLGLVVETGNRRVKVVFLATGEERSYATQTAPLSRVKFRAEEIARHGEGWHFKISQALVQDGLIIYQGVRTDTLDTVNVIETQLAHDMRVNQPQDRLLTNQFDRHKAFELRYESLKQRAKCLQSPLRGLLGARVDTIPHQLYIAKEVASRPSPRVLLADEVGLGKTVEAGLIIHHQLMNERAQRVLIIVPKALISQWLLELMRRFNLPAAVFDEQRCQEAEMDTGINPFLTEQIVVCSLDFFVDNPERIDQACDAMWDILVVDEAHHLAWSEEEVSEEYSLVEAIAESTPGLLLLTATPEQLGVASHFARLRLLDPMRFDDLQDFINEEEGYSAATNAIDVLLSDKDISESEYESLQALHDTLPAREQLGETGARDTVVKALTDRHGTGRVLFRNTRAHVKGFPERALLSYPVADDVEQIDWLITWLKSHKKKVLIICSQKERVLALEHRLHLSEGILCAAFHEDLGLLARDRAAAWFSEDTGAQALICSEIGSEGRNFQFAHHLVLLDLPGNPDLLEQRIGRLDRIGQQHDIQIHVPYLIGGQQELLFRWYHEALNAFEKNCKAAPALYQEFGPQLANSTKDPALFDQLIEKTQQRLLQINETLEAGRDRLLELSSFNKAAADELCAQFEESDDYQDLEAYVEQMCDSFGIDTELHSDHSLILSQGNHYKGGFKDISEDGTTITFDRKTALSNEDYKFMTWEHPLVSDGMDQVLSSSMGNSAIGTVKVPGLPEGLVMVECLLSVSTMAEAGLQIGRYLPPQLLRVVIDNEMRSIGKALGFNLLKSNVKKIDRTVAKQIIESQKPMFEAMITKATKLAEAALPKLVERASGRLKDELWPEVERTEYLKSINPSVRQEELQVLQQNYAASEQAIQKATVHLDAVRVLIVV